MSGYLLDTNVISAISPARPDYDAKFAEWLVEQEQASAVFLSAMTIAEMIRGVHLLRARNATAKADTIARFVDGIVDGYGDRILPFDIAVAREAGRLEARAISTGYSPGTADAVIAGTACHHGVTVITRNLRHFLPFELPLLSPEQCRRPA